MFQVIQIPGSTSSAFIPPQGIDPDIEQRNWFGARFKSRSHAGFPGRGKGNAIDLAVEINPIWRPAKLNNYAGFEQLLRGFDPRNIVIPKNFECFEKPCHIAGCSLKVEINISREPRITMKDDGFTPNNEVMDLEPAEQSDEFKHIRRKPCCTCHLRCHSRTSGWRPG